MKVLVTLSTMQLGGLTTQVETNLHLFQVRKVLKTRTCLKTMSMEYLQWKFPRNCWRMESTVFMVFDDKVDD